MGGNAFAEFNDFVGFVFSFFHQSSESVATIGGYGLTVTAGSNGLLLATVAAGFFGDELKQDLSTDSIMSVLFLGIFSTGFSVRLWLRGARCLGTTTAGLHQNRVPAFVMFIMFVLGEGFHWRQGTGGPLVISGAVKAQLWV